MDKSENLPGSSLSPQITRDYNIVRLLGKGGMGEVYLAEQLRVGRRHVALKVLNRSCCDDADLKRRFENEAASAGRIHHRNVVMVFESRVTDDGQLYVAMEYVDGKDLGRAIEEQGTIPVEETVRIIKQVAAGLNAAHKLGIVHRDIKPANIMLTHDEDGSLLVKVLDFGIARLGEADASGAQTKTGVVMGTPHYMSPEQTLGQTGEKIDHRSDIYSLAMVVYQMLTGRVAFESDSWVQVMLKHVNEAPQAPSLTRPDLAHLGPIDKVIFKGLEKDREKRQQSAIEFANELEAACGGCVSPGQSGSDTAQYTGWAKGLPFTAATPVQPTAPGTPAQPATDSYTPTVLTAPLPGASNATGQMGAVDTAGKARPAESFETVAMPPQRPTAVGTGSAQPVVSGTSAALPARHGSSAGKKIAAAASAVILLALGAVAYVVLHGRGGSSSEQVASNASITGTPAATPFQSPGSSGGEVATASPAAAVNAEGNANKKATQKEEGKEEKKEQKGDGAGAGAKPIAEETPKPGRNPHEMPSPTPAVRATPQPTPQPTPVPVTPVTPAGGGGDENASCMGVLVFGTQGNPIGGASVTVVDQTSGSRYQARTGPKGRARFCDLTPGHRYAVTAVGPRGMMSGQAQHIFTAGHNQVQIVLQ